jgi:MerR family transcriptional regulator, light-induced transcriptional regulator
MATAMGTGSSFEAATKTTLKHRTYGKGALALEGGRLTDGALGNLIHTEIIPRLLVAGPGGGNAREGEAVRGVDPDEAAWFAGLPLELEADELLEVVYGYVESGVAVESIFVDLLAPRRASWARAGKKTNATLWT